MIEHLIILGLFLAFLLIGASHAYLEARHRPNSTLNILIGMEQRRGQLINPPATDGASDPEL